MLLYAERLFGHVPRAAVVTIGAAAFVHGNEPPSAATHAADHLACCRLDARKAQIVELRFFGGLTIEQTARSLGVGTTTVEDDWAFARPWLRRELRQDDES